MYDLCMNYVKGNLGSCIIRELKAYVRHIDLKKARAALGFWRLATLGFRSLEIEMRP